MTTRSEPTQDAQAVETMLADRLSVLDKALPAAAAGLTTAEFLATGPRLSSFMTPVVTLDDSALEANAAAMAQWCAVRGVELATSGKTTMSPVLWDRQIRSGAWGVTLATASQVRSPGAAGPRADPCGRPRRCRDHP